MNESSPNSHISARDVCPARLAVQARKVVDIHHNNVEATAWPPSLKPDKNNSEISSKLADLQIKAPQKAYIHRKGAAPTHNPLTKHASFNPPFTRLSCYHNTHSSSHLLSHQRPRRSECPESRPRSRMGPLSCQSSHVRCGKICRQDRGPAQG